MSHHDLQEVSQQLADQDLPQNLIPVKYIIYLME